MQQLLHLLPEQKTIPKFSIHVISILGHGLAEFKTPLKTDWISEADFFARIREEVQQRKLFLNKRFSVAELAVFLGSNTKYVSAAINEATGMSFIHFINAFRIAESIRLILEHGDASKPEEIAEQSGFNSKSSFYRQFQLFTSLSPQEFSEAHKNQPQTGAFKMLAFTSQNENEL
jgi:AraC-like DNA-binding protein